MPHYPRPAFNEALARFSEIYNWNQDADGPALEDFLKKNPNAMTLYTNNSLEFRNLFHVAHKLGGKVEQNIASGLNGEPGGFENACPIRMSYVLNYTTAPVYASGQWHTVSGADGKLYIFKVPDFKQFLISAFGPPDKVVGHVFDPHDPVHTGVHKEEAPTDKGILVLDVKFTNARGHITLWDGFSCADECYFAPDFWTSGASIWRLR